MMKRMMCMLLVLTLMLSACGQPQNPEPTQPTEAPVLQQTEAATEEATLSVEEATEPVADYADYTEPVSLASKEDRKKINIFLSNFSEQWFHEFDEVRMQAQDRVFHTASGETWEFVRFAFLWYSLNSYKSFGYLDLDYGMEYLTRDQINQALERYFGISLSQKAFDDWDYENAVWDYQMMDDKILIPVADGESYPNFSVAQQMWGNGQGEYLVRFTVFALEEASTGGNRVTGERWYAMSWEEASVSAEMTKDMDGYAVVKEDQGSYRLVTYWLDGQTES